MLESEAHTCCWLLKPVILYIQRFFVKLFFFFEPWRFNNGMKLVPNYLKHDFDSRQLVILDSRT